MESISSKKSSKYEEKKEIQPEKKKLLNASMHKAKEQAERLGVQKQQPKP